MKAFERQMHLHQFGEIFDPAAADHIRTVDFHRAGTQSQLPRCTLVAEAGGQRAQNIALARRYFSKALLGGGACCQALLHADQRIGGPPDRLFQRIRAGRSVEQFTLAAAQQLACIVAAEVRGGDDQGGGGIAGEAPQQMMPLRRLQLLPLNDDNHAAPWGRRQVCESIYAKCSKSAQYAQTIGQQMVADICFIQQIDGHISVYHAFSLPKGSAAMKPDFVRNGAGAEVRPRRTVKAE